MIKAVIFDIDGVLLDSFQANLKFFQNLLVDCGYEAPTAEAYRPLFHRPLIDAIGELLKSLPEEKTQAIFNRAKEHRSRLYPVELIKLPEGVADVLDILSRQYKLGVVTSRIRQSVFEAPQLAAFKHHFQVIVAFEDTTDHKPHPQPLILAAEQLGVAVTDAVYIGDVENDVVAARAAGMKAVVYSQKHLPQADACTSLFTELPGIISRL